MKMIKISIKTVTEVEFFRFSNFIYSDIYIFFIYTHFIQDG